MRSFFTMADERARRLVEHAPVEEARQTGRETEACSAHLREILHRGGRLVHEGSVPSPSSCTSLSAGGARCSPHWRLQTVAGVCLPRSHFAVSATGTTTTCWVGHALPAAPGGHGERGRRNPPRIPHARTSRQRPGRGADSGGMARRTRAPEADVARSRASGAVGSAAVP
jgi:hypothetical protein